MKWYYTPFLASYIHIHIKIRRKLKFLKHCLLFFSEARFITQAGLDLLILLPSTVLTIASSKWTFSLSLPFHSIDSLDPRSFFIFLHLGTCLLCWYWTRACICWATPPSSMSSFTTEPRPQPQWAASPLSHTSISVSSFITEQRPQPQWAASVVNLFCLLSIFICLFPPVSPGKLVGLVITERWLYPSSSSHR